MPRIAYESHTFSASSEEVISRADRIIGEYQRQGFNLTLRQLYYQFVARGLLQNKFTEYKRLGDIINDGRLAGRIDWSAIEDRTRWLREGDHDHGDPDTWLGRVANDFQKSRWDDQPYRVEVWVEKDALAGVIESACDPLNVPWFACRGYASQSEIWGAAQRLGDHIRNGKQVVILHLGDHDPSGIDMTRDIENRLSNFLFHDWARAVIGGLGDLEEAELRERLAIARENGDGWDKQLEIRRLALNMDQVEQYQPPPNFAKITDSRAKGYINDYGTESWELDALDPATLSALITDAIEPLIHRDLWDEAELAEQKGRDRIRLVASNWQMAIDHITANGHADA